MPSVRRSRSGRLCGPPPIRADTEGTLWPRSVIGLTASTLNPSGSGRFFMAPPVGPRLEARRCLQNPGRCSARAPRGAKAQHPTHPDADGTVDELDRLPGLNSGAVACVCKPFSPREATARVNAFARRAEGRLGTGNPPWTIGDVDSMLHTCRRDAIRHCSHADGPTPTGIFLSIHDAVGLLGPSVLPLDCCAKVEQRNIKRK